MQLLPDRSIIDEGVVLDYPAARGETPPLIIGVEVRLRSGTVIYAGSLIGDRLETGHNVVIREGSRIGDDVSVWSNAFVDYGCVIGDRVKIHCNCYVAQYSELEDDVFLAPGVTLGNDLYPGRPGSAEAMQGPLIRTGAQIGVNATILPYVTIGKGAIVGAGAVVTKDIAAGTVAYGNPAVPVGRVEELGDVAERIRLRRSARAAAAIVPALEARR
jgi:acetyltransferase-like isoleucine patch superfamily enzyme